MFLDNGCRVIFKAKTKMSVYLKVKWAQIRLNGEKFHEKAKKIALAVLITQFILAGTHYFAANKNYWGIFEKIGRSHV